MIRPCQRLFACLLGLSALSSYFPAAFGAAKTDDWQPRALLQPTQDELQSEPEGRNVLQNDLTGTRIGVSMDKHFNRIHSKGFTGLVIAGESSGKPTDAPATGQPVGENDDC